jgi:hypothetical protein
VTKDEIQNKINIMITDKKHPLNDISHPGHKAAVEEYSRLQQDLIRLTRGRS